MVLTLPNGQSVDLEKVSGIGSVRDLGRDPSSIDKYILGFSVRLRTGESLQIKKQYHFNDWIQAKKELDAIHKDLTEKYNAFKHSKEAK